VKKSKYLFTELIDEIKEMYLSDGDKAFYKDESWGLFAKRGKVKLNSECFVIPDSEVDWDAQPPKLPEFAVQNKLEYVYSNEMLQDVISMAVDDDEEIPNKKIFKAIQYYDKYDTFMEL